MSWARRTYSLVPSMFLRTTAGSVAWYSNALPSPASSHRRVLEPLADLFTLGLGEVDLDLVGMRGAKLDPAVAQLLEPGQDRGEVPVLGDVVGDDAQLGHDFGISEQG